MLKKLASPKKKGLAQASFGAIGKDQAVSSDQSAASPSARSDKEKAKTKTKTNAKAKAKEEKEQTPEPQQASPPKSEPAVDARSETNESELAGGKQAKDAAEVPALERRLHRRSVLEKEAPMTQPGTSKVAGRQKTAAKKSKGDAVHEIKAIEEEGEEGGQTEATEAQENQAVEQGGASSDAKSDTKRGFLKSLTQATRGHRTSSTSAQQQEAASPTKNPTSKKEPLSIKKAKEQGTTEAAEEKAEEHAPSSSPRKQQKREKSKKQDSKPQDAGDNNNADDAGEQKRRDRRSKETAAPVSGNLSPIRRRPPSRSGAADAASGRTNTLPNQFAPLSQPEVHLIGEIVGGGGFTDCGSSSDGLICKWHVEYGSYWHHIAGHQLGQTQIAYPSPTTAFNQREDDKLAAVWAHPIDLHLTTSAFQGWPKLVFQVWRVNTHMSTRVAGYGFAAVPFAAGEHELRVHLWRPMGGSWVSELGAKLTGNTPELVTDDVVLRSAVADRCRLQTVATGTVCVRIGVMLRNLDGLKESLAG